eukprot:1176103-Rhodomonas_salina.1
MQWRLEREVCQGCVPACALSRTHSVPRYACALSAHQPQHVYTQARAAQPARCCSARTESCLRCHTQQPDWSVFTCCGVTTTTMTTMMLMMRAGGR